MSPNLRWQSCPQSALGASLAVFTLRVSLVIPISLDLCAEEYLFPDWAFDFAGRILKLRLKIRHAWILEALEDLSLLPFHWVLWASWWWKCDGGGCLFLPSLPKGTQVPALGDAVFPEKQNTPMQPWVEGGCQLSCPPPAHFPLV